MILPKGTRWTDWSSGVVRNPWSWICSRLGRWQWISGGTCSSYPYFDNDRSTFFGLVFIWLKSFSSPWKDSVIIQLSCVQWSSRASVFELNSPFFLHRDVPSCWFGHSLLPSLWDIYFFLNCLMNCQMLFQSTSFVWKQQGNSPRLAMKLLISQSCRNTLSPLKMEVLCIKWEYIYWIKAETHYNSILNASFQIQCGCVQKQND